MTSYDVVYHRFLTKIEDYDLPNLPDDELESMLHGWLLSAIAEFRKCKSDLSQRDDEIRTFLVDLADEEIEILAMLMVIKWLEPTINSCLLTKQFIGGKEEKYYSQAQQLSALMALRDSTRIEARKLMRDYSFAHHTYLSD